jgi:uncharacterized phage protein gp47/JayE
MTLTPRTFEQILLDMINYVRANTTISDFSVGSVTRTFLEACALEDDEQYFQMVKLLDSFRISSASGTDLDQRAADYNMLRLSAKESSGFAQFVNNALTKNTLATNSMAGSTSLTLTDGTSFPIAPANFNIRIGEGTPQVEDAIVISHTTAGVNFLTLSVALTQDHTADEQVAVVFGTDISISQGLQIQVPPTNFNNAIKFTTQSSAIIVTGNYHSSLVPIKSIELGLVNNVPAGKVSQFVSSGPFSGAGVTNVSATSGGRNVETDEEFRGRILRRFDELSKGTPFAIENGVIGIEDPLTGIRVASARLKEDFALLNHVLYVDDGTGMTPTVVNMGATSFAGAAVATVTTNIKVVDATNFPDAGILILSPGDAAKTEVATYSSKSIGASSYLILDVPVAKNHSSNEEVLLVEEVCSGAESGQKYFRLINWPIRLNTYRIFDNNSGIYTSLTEGTDYFINRSNGEVQYLQLGLQPGTKVYAHYSYVTGLLQVVQKVLNGDPANRTAFPGLVAAGIIVNVDTATKRKIPIYVTTVIGVGFDGNTVRQEVKTAVESYVNSLKMGDNLVLARIIEIAMLVSGVTNVAVKDPAQDQIILENELPVSQDLAGNSLVTVV